MKGFLAGVAVTVLVIAAFPSVGGAIVATRFAATGYLTGVGSGAMTARMTGMNGAGAARGMGFGQGYGQGRMRGAGDYAGAVD